MAVNFRTNKDTGPRTNEQITASEVRVISSTGKQLGIISIREALNHAEDEGFDLVEVSPDANPPVCKIIDYGKLKYREQKSKKEAKKKQKTIEVKEIKMRPGINTHDYNVKLKALSKFINGGNKVKVSMRFRGREMEHQNLGFDLLKKLTEEVIEYAKVEVPPKSEGKQIMMILVPQIVK
ncbi:MAG: Translation initiation factor IF-3 [Alphaproteobacteria bacterium MarineAlpha5_Bin5]|nr:MAG: Translation initiation factor IF-3 [Alphaproteobacteria bacterium MarineAlpha5_Bin5]